MIERTPGGNLAISPQSVGATQLTPDEFQRAFTGNVLVAEPLPGAGEFNYDQHRRLERAASRRRPLLVSGGLALATLAGWQLGFGAVASWPLGLLLAAKSIGLVVTLLLLAKSLGLSHPLLHRLCDTGTADGCHAVLTSPAAKLTSTISLAEVGFSYFAGTWLVLLILVNSEGSRTVLAALSVLSLPITAYSLHYQARVARQWCTLCCATLAVLWVEASLGAAYLIPPFSPPSPAEAATLLGCLLAPVVAWAFAKPYLLHATQSAGLQQQLTSFKRSRHLFESALAAQPRHELLPPTDAIRLGNPAARQLLTVVTSPTCPPCTDIHETLKRWLAQRDDLQVQVVFAVSGHPEDLRTQIATHLLTLHQQDPPTAEAALHDWYTNQPQGYASWLARHPCSYIAVTCLARHYTWCQQAGITSTPTILLNGQKLPSLYHLEDIKYLL